MTMQTVIQTPTFLADAKAAGLDDTELAEISATIATNPLIGDIVPGTGGARKIRFGGKGRGKSGGYRVITYYAAEDVPVFLLALVDKGQRADISQADRNALREILGTLADEYREGVRRKLRQTRTKRNT
jgi:mRNA-degrading endonuclease RelE of RelBE toxin-antitoxin system